MGCEIGGVAIALREVNTTGRMRGNCDGMPIDGARQMKVSVQIGGAEVRREAPSEQGWLLGEFQEKVEVRHRVC